MNVTISQRSTEHPSDNTWPLFRADRVGNLSPYWSIMGDLSPKYTCLLNWAVVLVVLELISANASPELFIFGGFRDR